jgi:hypothetical protein
MAHIVPFRGYRYDPGKVGRISDVVTPPYDRVYPEIQAACYERIPYNIVRPIRATATRRTSTPARPGSFTGGSTRGSSFVTSSRPCTSTTRSTRSRVDA